MVLLITNGVIAQPGSIPAHPRDLVFEPLAFTPPKAGDHRHELSNGATAFVVEDHTLPLVTLQVLIRTGAYLDPAGKEGLAGLTGSQLRAGGTTTLTPEAFDEEAAFLAVQIGSSIGDTQGTASLDSLTKDVDAALDLFFDMLRHPRFDQARLDLAKRQAIQGMQRRNDSTASIEGREWGRLMRGTEHFSVRPETQPSIEAITRDDLIAFHRTYYNPSRFVLAVAGDVATDEIIAKLERRMEDWRGEWAAVPPVPKPEFVPQPGLYLVDKSDVNQGRVSIGHLGTTRDNPDRYALLIMNDILGGGGFSSRLMTRVRSDEGLAYDVSSDFGIGVYYDGVFRAGFQSRSETVARATAIVREEIERIRTEQVSDQELRDSKASFVETFSQNFSSAASTASLFASDAYTGRDPEYLERYRANIQAVTAADVMRVGQQYLHPDRLVFLVVGNLEEMLAGDASNPQYSLEKMSPGPVTRVPLPDPLTMEYPGR